MEQGKNKKQKNNKTCRTPEKKDPIRGSLRREGKAVRKTQKAMIFIHGVSQYTCDVGQDYCVENILPKRVIYKAKF